MKECEILKNLNSCIDLLWKGNLLPEADVIICPVRLMVRSCGFVIDGFPSLDPVNPTLIQSQVITSASSLYPQSSNF